MLKRQPNHNNPDRNLERSSHSNPDRNLKRFHKLERQPNHNNPDLKKGDRRKAGKNNTIESRMTEKFIPL
jgi:hypothetical protein